MPENGQKTHAAKHAKSETVGRAHHQPVRRMRMALFVSIISISVGLTLIGIGGNAWSRGGYSNVVLASWWGIAGYLIFGFGGWFTYYSYVIKPAKAAESSKRSRIAKERPELFIEKAGMLPLEPGKPQKILLSVKNRGTLAARNINLGGANTRFLPKTFAGPLEYERVDSDARPDLAADAEAVMAVDAPMGITKEKIQLLKDGELLFFHYGKGEYEDDLGETYAIDFCFMFTPLAPTILRTCPTRFWPKGGGKTVAEKDRPELFVERVALDRFVVGQPNKLQVEIRNRGKITAHKVKLVTTHALLPSSFQGPLIYKTQRPDAWLPLGSDATMTHISISPTVMTDWQVTELMARRALLFHFGKGRYEDEAGREFPFEFCYMFEPSVGMVVCPEKYWPIAERRLNESDYDKDNG